MRSPTAWPRDLARRRRHNVAAGTLAPRERKLAASLGWVRLQFCEDCLIHFDAKARRVAEDDAAIFDVTVEPKQKTQWTYNYQFQKLTQ